MKELERYMRDISETPLLTKDEERQCGEDIVKGNEDAIMRMVKSNLRLVVSIAHDFKNRGLPLPDLISEGNIGLMTAARKFDPDKGAKFSTYAAWWIKQSMLRGISNMANTVRVPINSQRRIRDIRKFKIEFEKEEGYEPSYQDIAEGLKIRENTVRQLEISVKKTVSLSGTLIKGSETELEDVVADADAETPDDVVDSMLKMQQLKDALDVLDEREKLIIILRYGLDGKPPLTLEEVSGFIGRTRERVRQIQVASLEKLKKYYQNLDNQ